MIQKLLTRTDKVNIDKWQETQKKSSEKQLRISFKSFYLRVKFIKITTTQLENH